jgi:translation initiation factor IF-2
MSQQTTIRKLAELVNTPVEKLLEQLAEAGMSFSGPDQVVTSIEKVKLLGFLKRSHGKSDSAADEAAPGKIVLNRSRKQEITVGGGGKTGRGPSTIDVVVRKKVTLNKPGAGGAIDPDSEMAEIHRKLAESRQRNEAEQQALAAKDRQRAEEIAERKRLEEAEAERARLAAAEAAALEESGKPKPGHHGHPKPAPAREADKNAANKGKTAHRGSHAMVASVEDDDNTARFAGQLHLSASDRARRSSSANTRGKPKQRQRSLDQSRTGTGFQKPVAPMVREIAIGDAITVSDLAQKLALKGGDVVKQLFKMGVMATITQTIDHDTAVLVTEELGHKAVHADAGDAESELLAHVEAVQGDQARARRWSPSWATSTTARPRCWITSAPPRSPPAKRAASPSTSARTTCRRRRARSASSTPRAMPRSPRCASAARS